MAGNTNFLSKLRSFLKSLDSLLLNHLKIPHQLGILGRPEFGLDYGLVSNGGTSKAADSPRTLSEIFGGILHIKVPRNRRTIAKRLSRKHSEFLFKDARPKKNIVICLICGKPHEAETICGHCYDKVRQETIAMRENMDQDTYYYDHPRKEVAYLYHGEDAENIPKYKGHYIVEVPKKRPSWFPAPFFEKKGEDDTGDKS